MDFTTKFVISLAITFSVIALLFSVASAYKAIETERNMHRAIAHIRHTIELTRTPDDEWAELKAWQNKTASDSSVTPIR